MLITFVKLNGIGHETIIVILAGAVSGIKFCEEGLTPVRRYISHTCLWHTTIHNLLAMNLILCTQGSSQCEYTISSVMVPQLSLGQYQTAISS